MPTVARFRLVAIDCPDPQRLAQFYMAITGWEVDFDVPDLDDAEAQVLELGARRASFQPSEDFRVFLDPAGHPFCLVRASP